MAGTAAGVLAAPPLPDILKKRPFGGRFSINARIPFLVDLKISI
jgi:hypothetical protein